MTNETAPSMSPPPALPPVVTLYQLAIGHYVSRGLHVATRLRIADHLADGPRDPQEAESCGARWPKPTA